MKDIHKKLYKDIVMLLSNFSNTDKLNVGALLLKDNRIIATGYNGNPTGLPHQSIIENTHDISTIHAEMNCLSFAAKHGISVKDCTMFVSHFPCIHCTKMLYQSGIKKIYYINDYRNEDNKYKHIIEIEKINIK